MPVGRMLNIVEFPHKSRPYPIRIRLFSILSRPSPSSSPPRPVLPVDTCFDIIRYRVNTSESDSRPNYSDGVNRDQTVQKCLVFNLQETWSALGGHLPGWRCCSRLPRLSSFIWVWFKNVESNLWGLQPGRFRPHPILCSGRSTDIHTVYEGLWCVGDHNWSLIPN